MIDNVSILSTIVLIVIVIVKAVALDKKLPWFGKVQLLPRNKAP